MNCLETQGVLYQVQRKQLLAFSNTEIRLPTSRSEHNTRTTISNHLHIMRILANHVPDESQKATFTR